MREAVRERGRRGTGGHAARPHRGALRQPRAPTTGCSASTSPRRASRPTARPACPVASRHGTTPEPYDRLVREHLAAAGIALNGSAGIPVAARLVGRTLLQLLQLPEGHFRRQEVFTGSPPRRSCTRAGGRRRGPGSACPARPASSAVAPTGTTSSSRWPQRPTRRPSPRPEDDEAPRVGAPSAVAAQDRGARELRTFVLGLMDDLARGGRAPPARGASAPTWARRPSAPSCSGPGARAASAGRRRSARPPSGWSCALDRLAALDELEAAGRPRRLHPHAHRRARVGPRAGSAASARACSSGSVSMGLGLDLDLVVILGLAEGSFPAPSATTRCCPTREREAAGGELPLRRDQVDRQHRELLATLAGARPPGARAFPAATSAAAASGCRHGGCSTSRRQLAGSSGWAARPVAGRRALGRARGRRSTRAARPLAFPATGQEHRLRSLLAAGAGRASSPPSPRGDRRAGGRGRSSPARSPRFTRFDGNLAGLAIPSPVDRGSSATSLQRWAECPFAYFVQDLLRIEPVENPEESSSSPPSTGAASCTRCSSVFLIEVLAARRRQPADRRAVDAPTERLVADRRRGVRPLRGRGLDRPADLLASRAGRHPRRPEPFPDRGRRLPPRRRHQPVATELPFGSTAALARCRPAARRPVGPDARARPTGSTSVTTAPSTSSTTRPGRAAATSELSTEATRHRRHAAAARHLRPGGPPAPRRPARRGAGRLLVRHAAGAVRARSGTRSPPRSSTRSAEPRPDRRRDRGGRLRARTRRAVHAFRIACHFCDPDGLGTTELRRQWERKSHDPRWPATSTWPSRRGRGGERGPPTDPPDAAARDASRDDLDTHAVRRGRRRLGQDDRPRRSGGRARRRRRGRAAHRSRRSPSPRRPAPSCATASAASSRSRLAEPATRARSRPSGAGRRSTSSTARAIGTLHAFAQRILMENPVEAGLPPRIEVLDEVSSDVAFDRRWQRFRDELLADPALERDDPPAPRHAASNPTRCASLALTFEENWDLVEEQVPGRRRPSRPRSRDLLARSSTRSRAVSSARPTTAPTMTTRCASGSSSSRPTAESLADCAATTTRPRSTPAGRREGNRAQRRLGQASTGTGQGEVLRPTSARCATALARGRRGGAVLRRGARHLGAALRRVHARRRPRRGATPGQLAFHDLLVLARSLLRDPEHGAGGPAPASTTGTSGSCSTSSRTPTRSRSSWPSASRRPIPVRRGGLGAVVRGRRRARPPLRRRRPEAVDLPVPAGRHLHCSSRPGTASAPAAAGWSSSPPTSARPRPIIDWVNAHLRRADRPSEPTRGSVASQPRLRRPRRGARPSRRVGPAGRRCSGASAHRRTATPTSCARSRPVDVAARDRHASLDEGWTVEDDGEERLAQGRARRHHRPRARPHVAALPRGRPASRRHPVPGRVQLARLRHPGRARPAHGPAGRRRPHRPPAHRVGPAHAAARLRRRRPVPLQASSGAAAGATRGDQPDSVPGGRPGARSASRTSRELHERAPVDRPVGAARAHRPRPARLRDRLRRGPAARRVAPPPLRHRPGPGVVRGRPAGASASTSSGWSGRPQEGARVAEAVLPETDDDAVRIMTIHAAKGLEFPITIVSGMSTQARAVAGPPAEVVFPPAGGRRLPVREQRRHRRVRRVAARSTSR